MDALPATRQSLLLKLGARDPDAWARFFEDYEKAVRAYCRRLGLQDADAHDVTQEVLSAVDNRLGRGWDDDPQRGLFRGWVFRVARNLAADRHRQLLREARGTGDTLAARRLEAIPCDEAAQAHALEAEYRRALWERAAEQVRPRVQEQSWRAFWKTAVEGKRAEHVASELGTSIGAIYTAKCRVLARIRDVVASFDEPRDS